MRKKGAFVANFGMAEQYGIACSDTSEESFRMRATHRCPFLSAQCNKRGGVCSITDGATTTITCPNRFREDDLLFDEVCRIGFRTKHNCVAINEVDFLTAASDPAIFVGKIDNVVARLGPAGLVEWCALEVQAVYFSGSGMPKEIQFFETHHRLKQPAHRRPDYRSSGPKRLLPQLEVKVPTLRRWGKKMFVAIDEPFFRWMPKMQQVNDISNADICWLVFRLRPHAHTYRLELSETLLTTLEESRVGLVGGEAPPQAAFEAGVLEKVSTAESVVWRSRD